MKKLILFLITILLFTTTCRKYPDGPIQIGRNVPKMLQGKWKLTAYIINGIDSTAKYNARYNNKECFFDIPYLKYEYHGTELYIYISWNDTSGPHFLDERPFFGFWQHKYYIDVSAYSQYDSYGRVFNLGRLWEILKLTRNDFWFQVVNLSGIKETAPTIPSQEFHLTLISK